MGDTSRMKNCSVGFTIWRYRITRGDVGIHLAMKLVRLPLRREDTKGFPSVLVPWAQQPGNVNPPKMLDVVRGSVMRGAWKCYERCMLLVSVFPRMMWKVSEVVDLVFNQDSQADENNIVHASATSSR